MTRIGVLLAALLLATPCFGGGCPATTKDGLLPEPEVRRGHEVRFASLIAMINAQLAGGGDIDVLLLGDSIIQRWPRALVASALRTESVVNAGIPGDDTSALLWRLSERQVPARVDGRELRIGVQGWGNIRPHDVVLMIGTNDLVRRTNGCEVFASIRKVIDEIRSIYPKASLTVLSLLPRGDRMSQFADQIADINKSLALSAETAGFRFLNVHDAFLCDFQTNCPLMVPGTNVHPSAKGYEVLGALLAAIIGRS